MGMKMQTEAWKMFVGEKKWNLLKCFKINKKLRAKI
jgi:hypothetical protein